MHCMSQRMHSAPIGRNSVFVSSLANQRQEAARGHLVAESAERVHSSCVKGGGAWRRSKLHDETKERDVARACSTILRTNEKFNRKFTCVLRATFWMLLSTRTQGGERKRRFSSLLIHLGVLKETDASAGTN